MMSSYPTEQQGVFPSTHWSLVEAAGPSSGMPGREALARLIERYSPALRRHLIVAKGLRADEVEDLLQGFVAEKILEQAIIQHADKCRGKFRSFLLVTLDRFCANARRFKSAGVRNPQIRTSLDSAGEVASKTASASEAFDIAWAREVTAQAVEQMRKQCIAAGRQDLWGVFEGRILIPSLGQGEIIPYSELVVRYKFVSPSQASNALITANRQFRRALRSVIGTYEMNDDAIDAEILDLRRILASAGAG